MTRRQYRVALKRLGLSQIEAASLVGRSRRQGQRYAAEGCNDGAVVILLKLMLRGDITPEQIRSLK